MGWSLPVACLAFVALFAGCTDDDTTSGPDGHYVYYNWGKSQKSCTNNVCTYGTNHETFSIPLECTVAPTLSWDSKNWVHGSVQATVSDDEGTVVETKTISTTSHGTVVVEGEPGTWTLAGHTQNANGNLQIRLTCGP